MIKVLIDERSSIDFIKIEITRDTGERLSYVLNKYEIAAMYGTEVPITVAIQSIMTLFKKKENPE